VHVNDDGPRYEARLEVRAIQADADERRRRVFTWRNFFRRAPRIAEQPGCPLQVLRPRFYSFASVGSRIGSSLQFDLRNTSDKTVHSYFWRHASPVREANGGFGCQPDGGMSPHTEHREGAYLAWRGPLTITIELVQFLDGGLWLPSDPQGSISQARLTAGSRSAADHLLRVWREGGTQSLAAALPHIHRDVRETAAASREQGRTASFYAGVTHAAVVVRSIKDGDVEEALLALRSTGT
jgi:hypothetical protein